MERERGPANERGSAGSFVRLQPMGMEVASHCRSLITVKEKRADN